MRTHSLSVSLFTVKNPLFRLAVLMDNCTSREECTDILLSEKNYRIAYSKSQLKGYTEHSLYHFIRSQIAFYQMDFFWFQKETLALIELWLNHESETQFYFGDLSSNQLFILLAFGQKITSARFVDFIQEENLSNDLTLNQSTKQALLNLHADKKRFLEMSNVF